MQDQEEQMKADLEDGILFHGLIDKKYEATAKIELNSHVQGYLSHKIFTGLPTQTVFSQASECYPMVRLAEIHGTEDVIYGVFSKLADQNKTILFNAFYRCPRPPKCYQLDHERAYLRMEDLVQLKLFLINKHLQLAIKMCKDGLVIGEDPNHSFPSLVWFSPRP